VLWRTLGLDEIDRYAAFPITTANREHQDGVVRSETRAAQPLDERRFPALVVRSGRQLRDVVCGRIGLDPTNLAKVIHCMRRVARRAANTEDEQRHLVL